MISEFPQWANRWAEGKTYT